MTQTGWLQNRRWIATLLSLVLGLGLVPAGAQTHAGSRAGLIVQRGDGSVATYCVRFGEPSITGLELLNRAGVSVVAEVSGLGSAVCAIGGEGCAYPAQPCFCQCQGATCAYWNYLHLIDGAWRYSPIGAAGYTISDGAVDGWAWGDKTTPPLYTIDHICSASSTAPVGGSVAATPTARSRTTVEPTATSEAANRPEPAPLAQVSHTPEPVVPTQSAAPIDSAASSDTSAVTDSPQADVGSYAIFLAVVVALSGWLIAAQLRKK